MTVLQARPVRRCSHDPPRRARPPERGMSGEQEGALRWAGLARPAAYTSGAGSRSGGGGRSARPPPPPPPPPEAEAGAKTGVGRKCRAAAAAAAFARLGTQHGERAGPRLGLGLGLDCPSRAEGKRGKERQGRLPVAAEGVTGGGGGGGRWVPSRRRVGPSSPTVPRKRVRQQPTAADQEQPPAFGPPRPPSAGSSQRLLRSPPSTHSLTHIHSLPTLTAMAAARNNALRHWLSPPHVGLSPGRMRGRRIAGGGGGPFLLSRTHRTNKWALLADPERRPLGTV